MLQKLRWSDTFGRNYIAEIKEYGSNGTDESVTEITPARTVFTTEEDNDTNLMKPVRLTTGRLSVLKDWKHVLSIDNDREYTITVQSDGELLFYGFLKSENLDMELSADVEEFSYNIIDALGAMKATRPPSYKTATIGQILTDAAASVGVKRIIYDASVPGIEGNIQNVLSAQIDSWQWYNDDTGLMNDYAAIFEDICRSIGVTARTYKDAIFLSCVIPNGNTQALVGSNFTDWNSIQPVYAGRHTYHYLQAPKDVNITASGKKYSMTSASLDEGAKFVGYVKGEGWVKDRTFPFYYRTFTSGKHVTLTNVADATRIISVRGSYLMDVDYWWTAEEWDPGSAKWEYTKDTSGKDVLNVSGQEKKKNVEFTRTAYQVQDLKADNGVTSLFGGIPFGGSTHVTNPNGSGLTLALQNLKNSVKAVAPIRMEIPSVNVRGGGIDIRIDCCPADGLTKNSKWSPFKHWNPTYDNQETPLFVRCELGIGGKWWNGSQWSTTRGWFEIAINKRPYNEASFTGVDSNKTYRMDFSADGFVVPINGQMRGKLTFGVLASYYARTTDNSQTVGGIIQQPTEGWAILKHVDVMAFNNISVKYCEDFNTNLLEDEERKSSELINHGGQSVDVDCVLSTSGVRDSAGMMYLNGEPVSGVRWGESSGSLAELLLSRYKSTVGHINALIDISCKMVQCVPRGTIVFEDEELPIVSISRDYSTGTMKVRALANSVVI